MYLRESSDSESDYSRRLGVSNDDCPRALIDINGTSLDHVLDTGASINILTRRSYDSLLPKPDLQKYRRHLYAYHTKQEVRFWENSQL